MPSPLVLPAAGVLACDEEHLSRAKAVLSRRFGGPLSLGPVFPFSFTSYYVGQTGSGAVKQFLVFPPPAEPPSLAGWKRWSNEREKALAASSPSSLPRPVNIDPGMISLGNLCLASTKDAPHRVLVGEGIFAEVELIWQGGTFAPLPWTYPDYRTPSALAFFAGARALLKKLRRG